MAVSSDVAADMLRHRIPQDKMVIIDNGIDFTRFDDIVDGNAARGALGIPENAKIIGTIGGLKPAKGHEYLLRSTANILRTHKDVKLLIVGDGPLRHYLDELAHNLGIDNSVLLTGYRKDVPELLSAMDMFVLPSLTEGLPIVVLEAMAANRPVIATAVGAIPKIITDNETGFLVPPSDVSALEAAISSLIDDGANARRVAVAGSAKVRREFSSERMCRRYLDVYGQVLRQKISPMSLPSA